MQCNKTSRAKTIKLLSSLDKQGQVGLYSKDLHQLFSGGKEHLHCTTESVFFLVLCQEWIIFCNLILLIHFITSSSADYIGAFDQNRCSGGNENDDSAWFEPLKAPEEWLTGGWKGGKIVARVTVEEGVKAELQRECDTAPGQSDGWVILSAARNRLFSAQLSNTASVKEENVKGASLLKTIYTVIKVW